MLLRIAIIVVNYHIIHQIGWLLRALMFLSSSILILILQPYKKSYVNVLDGLLLALLGFLVLLLVTFLYILPSANETLPLLMVIVCGVPQLVLLLSVTYTQLKGKQVAYYIAGKVSTLLKQIYRQNQAEGEHSDADSLPHRLISPNQYSTSLLLESKQAHAKTDSEPLTVRGRVPPVYNYGSVS